MMAEGGVEVDGKSDEAMLKVICETDAGGMNHVIHVVPSDVLSPSQAGRPWKTACQIQSSARAQKMTWGIAGRGSIRVRTVILFRSLFK